MSCGVLIVEDDADLLEDLAFLVESQGHQVSRASNGEEALQRMVERGRPCLILMDLIMPVMDGWKLRSELLKDPNLRDVPVVLLSATSDLQGEALSLKAEDFVAKPIDIEKLYQLVARYC